MIGDLTPSEWTTFADDDTKREINRLTNGHGNSYPLYYFVPSITRDCRYLIFHSERSSWVQLYRLDLETGEIGQLTDGRTLNSGWAVWCEWRLRGIYNHLSALNVVNDDVFYFEDTQLRSTNLTTFKNQLVTQLPAGRMPISQCAFSPDGSLFAFVHVDTDRYVELVRDREFLTNMRLFDYGRDHHGFRDSIGAVLSVVDTKTGEMRTVIETDFHFHHALFLDNSTILLNHPKGTDGMWTVDVDGSNVRHLRPEDAPGAHNLSVCHQAITQRGIVYEATAMPVAGKRTIYLGRYDTGTDSFDEFLLPLDGAVHTGNDPAGEFWFVEHAGTRHELLAVHPGPAGDPADVQLLRTLSSPTIQQRHHAHPFLSPDRTHMYFTDWDENGFSQVHRMNVADLTT